MWLGRAGVATRGEGGEELLETGRTRFVRGLLVALSNPKTIVFFTAFLPQFIDPHLPAGPQFAAMCVASVLIAGASDCAWAVAAGMGRAWFMKPPRQNARPAFGNSPHRRRFVAVARPTDELISTSGSHALAMPNLTTIISVAGASFAASFVEAVEALTMVLAVGLARGWRPALTGAAAALAALTVIVALLGPLMRVVPLRALQFVVGVLCCCSGYAGCERRFCARSA